MSSNERQYRSYLDHVENIGTTCGFDVEEDVLRIPSTKRVRIPNIPVLGQIWLDLLFGFNLVLQIN